MSVIDITQTIASNKALDALMEALNGHRDQRVEQVAQLLLFKYRQVQKRRPPGPVVIWLNSKDEGWPSGIDKPSALARVLMSRGLLELNPSVIYTSLHDNGKAVSTKPTSELLRLLEAIAGPLPPERPEEPPQRNRQEILNASKLEMLQRENKDLKAKLKKAEAHTRQWKKLYDRKHETMKDHDQTTEPTTVANNKQ